MPKKASLSARLSVITVFVGVFIWTTCDNTDSRLYLNDKIKLCWCLVDYELTNVFPSVFLN